MVTADIYVDLPDIAEYSCGAARDYFLPGERKTFYPLLRFYYSLRSMGRDKTPLVMSVRKFNRNRHLPISKTF